MNDTRILEIKHIPGDWHQYEVKLNFTYGWGYIIKSAVNVAQKDLMSVDLLSIADKNGQATDLTASLQSVGGDINKCPELIKEHQALSIAGNSGELKLPTRMIWFNEMPFFRIFTVMEVSEEDLRNYISDKILLSA